jgi:predicted Zn-dependent protease
LLLAAAALPWPNRIQAQTESATPPAARLELGGASEQAKALFREAIFEAQNVGGAARIRRAIDSAVKLSPQLTLARVYQAFTGPGTGEVRAQAITDLMSTMVSAPPAELLLALYWREVAAGRGPAAVPVLRSLTELVPGEVDIAWMYVNTQVVGKPVAEQIRMRRDFIQKHPTYAAARNTIAYQLAATDLEAAIQEIREYVRLVPTYPNAHDSYADLLLLQRKPAEALQHVQRELELDPQFTAGSMKLGTIQLMMGDAASARAVFAREQEKYSDPATKREFTYWTAATYAHSGDVKGARSTLTSILSTQLTPAQTAVVHERLAAIEAYLGDRKTVAGHLTASDAGSPPAAHFAIKAIVLARINDLEQARAAVKQYTSMVPATNTVPRVLNAYIAMQAKDLTTAESELAASTTNDLFTKAIRADLFARKGQKAESAALRQEIISSSMKLDGNAPVDFFKLMAKMHVDKL